MLKEIGSNFWLKESPINIEKESQCVNMTEYGINGDDEVLLSTGRASICYAIRDIKQARLEQPLKALIPPYTCDTVLSSFLDENIDIYVYDINYKLEVDKKSFREKLERIKPDIVFIHSYFGFDTVQNINDDITFYKKNGGIVIEDRTQSFFSKLNLLDADYIVGSFRKWDALPDGGFCVKVKGSFCNEGKFLTEDNNLVKKKLEAFYAKEKYMIHDIGNKEVFLDLYNDAECILDSEEKFFCMSQISRHLLKRIDIAQLIKKRRENYRFTYENINNKHMSFLTGVLEKGVVPLYMTIRTSRRDMLQKRLREANIYAPIVWPKPTKMPMVSEVVERIYKEVLCLPIDQRYDIEDMRRMVSVINSFDGD